MTKRTVAIYSIMHFVVDLCCAILVKNAVAQRTDQASVLFVAILIYNFFAFAIQFPIGIAADRLGKNALCAALGCLLVAFSFAVCDYAILACMIAGVGNAMFHIGGGIDVLERSDKKASLSGIYVSTGALGIFLGSLTLYTEITYYIASAALILGAAVIMWLLRKNKTPCKKKELPSLYRGEKIAVICLIITVCLRSYVGMILAFEWKANMVLAVVSVLAVVFGKMLGGIIGDKVGFMKISKISLLCAAVCFMFAFDNFVLGILAIAFFNMTMPLTLTMLSNILGEHRGMAFGLLTFALFIGALPTFFGFGAALFTPLGLFVLTAVSLVVLYIAVLKYNVFMGAKDDSKLTDVACGNIDN